MFAGLAPVGNSNRRFHITGYTGWDRLLSLLPRGLHAKLIAKRVIAQLGAVTGPENAIAITFPDGQVYEIIGPRGQVRPYSRSVPE